VQIIVTTECANVCIFYIRLFFVCQFGLSSNKYERWVEIEPTHSPVLKRAWQFLLTGQYTLKQICDELDKLVYTRASGRLWVWDDPKNGKRRNAEIRLRKIFHNPFYAGWVVSERFKIKMVEVRGMMPIFGEPDTPLYQQKWPTILPASFFDDLSGHPRAIQSYKAMCDAWLATSPWNGGTCGTTTSTTISIA